MDNDSKIIEAIKNGAFLVDVRTEVEFLGGSVHKAINIPLDQIPNNLDKFQEPKNIVVFCRSGNRSAQAEAFLKQNGITNVINGGTWNHVAYLLEKSM